MIEQTIIIQYGEGYGTRLDIENNKPLDNYFTKRHEGVTPDENCYTVHLDDDGCYILYLWLTLQLGQGNENGDNIYTPDERDDLLEVYDELVEVVRSGHMGSVEIVYQYEDIEFAAEDEKE